MGEKNNSIFVIGSPDLDLMNPKTLPSLEKVKNYYDIKFDKYAILMYHPVTTEYDYSSKNIKSVVDAVIESGKNYIVIYPNNDLGSYEILNEYKRFHNNDNFKIFPSLRFEYFLRLLYDAEFIVGNSSVGVREAPFYNVPTIDIGTRQLNSSKNENIIHVDTESKLIIKAIEKIKDLNIKTLDKTYFGEGKSDKKFFELLNGDEFWEIACQKQFQDIL